MWLSRRVMLKPRKRGFHLVQDEIESALPELREIRTGLLHLLIQHTSASLALNENADPTVRADMEAYFSRLAPENEPYFRHTLEGADDMPAHLKAILIGPTLSLPIHHGHLMLGTWQGVYLCEHRNHGGSRTIWATLQGE